MGWQLAGGTPLSVLLWDTVEAVRLVLVGTLSANVRETPTPRKFSVEGETGFQHVHDDGGPAVGGGDRGGGEGAAAAVHGRREAAGAARG